MSTTNDIADLLRRGIEAARDGRSTEARALFEQVVESSKLNLRKPDPRIYRHACDLLGVEPEACVYLDDLGVNCKPARAMGMTTIKVSSAEQAIDELEALLGIALRERAGP